MEYVITHNKQNGRFIEIECSFNSNKETTYIDLPRWRPGRYEISDFVQQVRDLEFFDSQGMRIDFIKTDISTWKIKNNGKSFTAKYRFYCKELNAGSSWIEEDLLYVNPVNCLMYNEDEVKQECLVTLKADSSWTFAGGAHYNDNKFIVKDYQELVDTPFFLSPNLKHLEFNESGIKFHVWFYGECRPNMEKIKNDFIAYTKEQLIVMGDFPVHEYHYLNIITNYKHYHGVEHQKSTVITLGPGYDLMGKSYEDFMGVSSHELFHTWNVKKVRPLEMTPYDFQQPNFNRLGYVTEGLTTYYGDLFLRRSNYFTNESFFKELETRFRAHFENDGRFNKSVADASFDTWIDGYVRGIPHMKTNIYTEGMMCALMCDLSIRLHSNHEFSLDNVIRDLYDSFGKNDKGYSEEDYLTILRHYGDEETERIINNFLYNTNDYEETLRNLFSQFGIKLSRHKNPSFITSMLGIHLKSDKQTIDRVSVDSEAFKLNLVEGTKILAINDITLKSNTDEWLSYFSEDEKVKLLVEFENNLRTVTVDLKGDFYPMRKLSIKSDISNKEQVALNNWLNSKA